MVYKYFQDAVNWFGELDGPEKDRIKSECPASWKGSTIDFYEWVSDAYKKQIAEYVKSEKK